MCTNEEDWGKSLRELTQGHRMYLKTPNDKYEGDPSEAQHRGGEQIPVLVSHRVVLASSCLL